MMFESVASGAGATRRVMYAAFFTLILTLVAAGPAAALAVGDKATGQFTLGSKQIPLPEGNWTVVGLGAQDFTNKELGAFGTIQNVVLFLVRENAVQAILEVNGNTIPVNDGWGRTKACAEDPQTLMIVTRYRTGWETSCQFVRATRFDADTKGPAAWEQARNHARQNKLSLSKVWLTAGFRVSDRQDLVDVRYHINPTELLGPDAARLADVADWSPDAVKDDPLRQGATKAVASWATGFAAWVERGLRNQITAAPGALPGVGVRPAAFEDAKLGDLRRLYGEGRISREVYEEQAKLAEKELLEYKPNTSLVSNSVRKNISFRSFGTFVDYGIAYVVTASNFVSWGIALTLNATDSVWFVLNDQYWDGYYAKLSTHNADRQIDFVYIGDTGAPIGKDSRV
jgi:uncharacterized membrane protein